MIMRQDWSAFWTSRTDGRSLTLAFDNQTGFRNRVEASWQKFAQARFEIE
jgi:hypothetical protein